MPKSLKLSEAAVMTALSFVLAWISKLIPAPWLQGGSITIASAVPIMVVSIIFGIETGILSSIVFAVLQMITGFYAPPAADLMSFITVVIIDYIVAFGVYGLTGFFYRLMSRKNVAIPVSGGICMVLRYVCHIISGILIWGVYDEEGKGLLAYSVIYNGGYMIPEIIITVIALSLMIPVIKRIEKRYNR